MSTDLALSAISISQENSSAGMMPQEEAWLFCQDAFETTAANRIAVELTPGRLHPLLVSLHKQLLDKAKRTEKVGRDATRAAECNARLLGKAGKTVDARLLESVDYEWRRFVEDGQPLETSYKAVCLRVTPGTQAVHSLLSLDCHKII